jgi:hypothetical protein
LIGSRFILLLQLCNLALQLFHLRKVREVLRCLLLGNTLDSQELDILRDHDDLLVRPSQRHRLPESAH